MRIAYPRTSRAAFAPFVLPTELCVVRCGSLFGVAPFGDVNALHAFFLWYYPWAVTGAIWTVMTQV